MISDHGNADGAALSSPNIHTVSNQRKHLSQQPKHTSPTIHTTSKTSIMPVLTQSPAENGNGNPARKETPHDKAPPSPANAKKDTPNAAKDQTATPKATTAKKAKTTPRKAKVRRKL
jgi:hypothetical protein